MAGLIFCLTNKQCLLPIKIKIAVLETSLNFRLGLQKVRECFSRGSTPLIPGSWRPPKNLRKGTFSAKIVDVAPEEPIIHSAKTSPNEAKRLANREPTGFRQNGKETARTHSLAPSKM